MNAEGTAGFYFGQKWFDGRTVVWNLTMVGLKRLLSV